VGRGSLISSAAEQTQGLELFLKDQGIQSRLLFRYFLSTGIFCRWSRYHSPQKDHTQLSALRQKRRTFDTHPSPFHAFILWWSCRRIRWQDQAWHRL